MLDVTKLLIDLVSEIVISFFLKLTLALKKIHDK